MLELLVGGPLVAGTLAAAGSLAREKLLPFSIAHYTILSLGILLALGLPAALSVLLTPALSLVLGSTAEAVALSLALGLGLQILSGVQVGPYLMGTYTFHPLLLLPIGFLLYLLWDPWPVFAWYLPEMAIARGKEAKATLPLLFLASSVAAGAFLFGMLFVPAAAVFPSEIVLVFAREDWTLRKFLLFSFLAGAGLFLVALFVPVLPLGITVSFLGGGLLLLLRTLKARGFI